jgi:hypothetical protein
MIPKLGEIPARACPAPVPAVELPWLGIGGVMSRTTKTALVFILLAIPMGFALAISMNGGF